MKLRRRRLRFNIICSPRSDSFCNTPPPARSCRSAWAWPPRNEFSGESMNQLLEDLIKVMTLERLEMNLFRGQSRDIGSPQVFGRPGLGPAPGAGTGTAGAGG